MESVSFVSVCNVMGVCNVIVVIYVHFLPTKYLIDKKGNIVCRIDEDKEKDIDAMIEKLLAE